MFSVSFLKFPSLVICVLLLTSCGTQYRPLTTEQMKAIDNSAETKLAIAQERMKTLRLEISNIGYSEEKATEYINARCEFLRESEYLYSDYASVPCYVKTAFLREPKVDYINRANATLIQNFKDPESVKFRNISLSLVDVPIVCGEVNGKNSYGGYTGFKKYYATDTKDFGGVDDGSGRFSTIWDRYCQK
ncbi:MAG: hypothetical protein GZ093_17965 [Rhodoferax sp.]|uniref:hypothetical protein n=1 Tax=Rhodoferax sp. TaxID=50421 RepID=UPI0013FF41A2|nr:hypothetical protein [Rhodoferax sp.]NDP40593.1 hypothetical protein [Rhodoferax sp.]